MLPSGTRLGSYEIVGPLGSGGMGEVYRAHDTRLGRDVAIKVLPASFAAGADGGGATVAARSGAQADHLARFEREARAVASLSHPNILAVHEFGAHQGQPFVVMELLAGQTLRERLAEGPLPVRKAVDVATQIARGLAAAHEKHLVHRDLKPENVFLLDDGQVKILDFGLARWSPGASAPGASAPGSEDPGLHVGATVTAAMTDPGTVMGTVGYMAPEQVRAGDVDARTDLFALGLVLYEMLAGTRAFRRETAAETMTAILREDPLDLATLRPDLPPALVRIVQHAIEKNPAERFQTARDVVFALTSLSGSGTAASGSAAVSGSGAAEAVSARRPSRLPLVAGVAALVLGAAAGGWWLGHRGQAPDVRWDRFTQLTDQAGEETAPRISPDGSSFVYASRARGSWDIYTQRVGGRNPALVVGDPKRDEMWPAFSPDGRQIAFDESDVDGGLFLIGATGESERRLTDFGANPAWSPDGKTIAFANEEVQDPYNRTAISQLWTVDVAGGTPKKISDGDAVQPAWSPDGRRIAFWSNIGGQRDLLTVAPDGSDQQRLTADAPLDWAPVWSPDGRWLYFASDRGGSMGIWRLPMDEATGRATGQPESVTAGVEARMDLPSFSADGKTMVFRAMTRSTNPTAIPFDPATERTGTPYALTTRTGMLDPTSVSPDGQWLALTNIGERQEDLFLMKRDGSELRRLTDDAARDRSPQWTGDGKAILFFSNRGGRYDTYSIRPDGSGLMPLADAAVETYYPVLAPDGRLFLGADAGTLVARPPFPAPQDRIEKLPGATLPEGVLQASRISPDGRWLTGALLPASGLPSGIAVYDLKRGQLRLLTHDAGVYSANFLPDSRRFLYITLDGTLVVVDVVSGERRVIPVKLPFLPDTDSTTIAPDGRTIYYGAVRAEANVWKADERPGGR